MSSRIKLAELVGWVERSDTHQPGDGYRYAQPILRNHQHGFTLVEMIIVIVITGIIGGIVAVFLKAPVQQYVDVARRADMTDIADTALRRISRDLRLALPNSVRVTGTCNGTSTCFIEFLPTSGGGRYRATPPGNELDFSSASDGGFDVLGPPITATANDFLVIYNLGIPSVGGCAALGADAYEGCNRRAIVTSGGAITFTPTALPFPFDSPGHRFHVISTPVSYVCIPVPGGVGGVLWRYWGYSIQDVQTKTDSIAELDALALPATATKGKALLATNVSSCRFTYDASVVAQRSGLVTMHLAITQEGETVTLYNAAHVSNQP